MKCQVCGVTLPAWLLSTFPIRSGFNAAAEQIALSRRRNEARCYRHRTWLEDQLIPEPVAAG